MVTWGTDMSKPDPTPYMDFLESIFEVDGASETADGGPQGPSGTVSASAPAALTGPLGLVTAAQCPFRPEIKLEPQGLPDTPQAPGAAPPPEPYSHREKDSGQQWAAPEDTSPGSGAPRGAHSSVASEQVARADDSNYIDVDSSHNVAPGPRAAGPTASADDGNVALGPTAAGPRTGADDGNVAIGLTASADDGNVAPGPTAAGPMTGADDASLMISPTVAAHPPSFVQPEGKPKREDVEGMRLFVQQRERQREDAERMRVFVQAERERDDVERMRALERERDRVVDLLIATGRFARYVPLEEKRKKDQERLHPPSPKG
jgi:hypothetical protein